MKMSLFGIPDPAVWFAYVGCVATIVFCVIWARVKNKEEPEDE